jgi:hypothetical protein
MIQSIHVTNSAGNTLDLNLWNIAIGDSLGADRLRIFNIEGLGSPKAVVEGLSGPLYDGVTGHFVKTDPRHILITLVIPRRGNYEEIARREIYEYFPGKEEIKFRVVTDTKDVYTMATVESVEMNHFSKSVNAVISLYCPYPYFLDQIDSSQYAEFKGTSQAIVHEGDFAVGGLFTLYFGQDNETYLILENSNGDQTFTLNYTYVPGGLVQAGDKIYIDTRGGQNQVIHELYNGITQTDITLGVSPNSDWLQILPGTNWFSLTLDSLEGKETDAPNDLYLTFFLPLNEGVERDPYELVTNTDMDVFTGSLASGKGEGRMYPHARLFDETEEAYVQANTHTWWCPDNDFTIILWLKTSEVSFSPASEKHYLVSVEDDPTDSWRLWFSKDDTSFVTFGVRVISTWYEIEEDYIDEDVWTCWICTFNDDLGGMSIRRMPGTANSRSDVAPLATYSSSILIGGGVSGEKYWDGYMQGLAVYKGIILTSVQQTWIYNNGKGRTFAELTGTVELFVDYEQGYQGI